MTFSLQLQPNTKLSIDKIKKMLSDNKIKSIKSSNSELYCFANLSLNEIKLILVNNINSNEIVHLYEYAKKTMIKVQLSIINNEQMNKTNTKFNTWQSYCKYLDEKIDRVDKKIDNVRIELLDKIDEIKEQIMSAVTIQIEGLKEEIMLAIKTEIKNLRSK